MLVKLPIAPIEGVIRLGELVQRQVEQELYGTSAVRAQLEAVAEQRAAGLIDEAEQARAEREILARRFRGRTAT